MHISPIFHPEMLVNSVKYSPPLDKPFLLSIKVSLSFVSDNQVFILFF